jgi:hypothetical protein
MGAKKWSLTILAICVSLFALVGITVAFVDPFFHYRAPHRFSYTLDHEVYRNDGITKHFAYSAMILGSSTTEYFQTAEANELFHADFIRVTYLGEGFKITNDSLKTAIAYNQDLRLVIRGLDTWAFVTAADWTEHSNYPYYLYDDSPWNDIAYLLNKDVLVKGVWPMVLRTLKNEPAKDFDDDIHEYVSRTGKENMLRVYKRQPKEIKIIEETETEMFFANLEKNLAENVVATIVANPDIEFYLFFPPYSICWWDSLAQNGQGVVRRRIEMERYAMERLLGYDNVKLFSFFNNYALICDLDNYVDEVHYSSEVYSEILRWMAAGEYQITEENYQAYLSEITEFYCNYDYDAIFN